MQMTVDEILNMPVDQIERPKPIPQGTYLARVGKHVKGYTKPKDGRDPTPLYKFRIHLVKPTEDVDPEALEAFGGIETISQTEIDYDFYMTDRAAFMLKEFLVKACRLDGTGKSLAQLMPESNGVYVLASIKHSVSQKDNESIYANIDSFAAASES